MTNKKLLILLSGCAAVILVGFIIFSLVGGSKDDAPESINTDSTTSIEGDQQSEQQQEDIEVVSYTSEDVAEKNSPNECWTIIDNKVYNITEYISQHPGGSEIERACGIDASSLFNNRTTEDGEDVGSGTPHSSSANRSLQQYYIGDLR